MKTGNLYQEIKSNIKSVPAFKPSEQQFVMRGTKLETHIPPVIWRQSLEVCGISNYGNANI